MGNFSPLIILYEPFFIIFYGDKERKLVSDNGTGGGAGQLPAAWPEEDAGSGEPG